MVRPRPWPARGPMEQRFASEVANDLARTRPNLLLVLRPNPTVRGGGGARRFDYLQYFIDVPGFQHRVLDHYRLDGRVGSYSVFWRRDLPTGTRAMAEAAPRYPTLRPSLAGMAAMLVVGAGMAGFAWAWHHTRRRHRSEVG